MLLAITTMLLCCQINAEARTTQQRDALLRLYHFLGYRLHTRYLPNE